MTTPREFAIIQVTPQGFGRSDALHPLVTLGQEDVLEFVSQRDDAVRVEVPPDVFETFSGGQVESPVNLPSGGVAEFRVKKGARTGNYNIGLKVMTQGVNDVLMGKICVTE